MRYTDLGALISPCGLFRYRLWRRWDDQRPVLVWIMLNPSKADGTQDDNTIRKIVRFAEMWGFGGIEVVNLFAYRATDPKDLAFAGYPSGPDNDKHLTAVLKTYTHFVAAWGGNADNKWGLDCIHWLAHVWERETTYTHRDIWALKLGKKGTPWHPLYVPYAQERVSFRLEEFA